MPRRIPHQLDVGFFNLVEGKEFGLDIPSDLSAEMAARRRQRHFDVNASSLECDVINEAKVNNVEGDFRVVAIPKLVPYLLFRQRRINNRRLLVRKVTCPSRTGGTLRIQGGRLS